MKFDFDKADAMAAQFTDYAKQLDNAERLHLAAFLLGLTNAVQQHADIPHPAIAAAQDECMTLFQDVEEDDPMDPGYHLHNMLENLADDFDALANLMAEFA